MGYGNVYGSCVYILYIGLKLSVVGLRALYRVYMLRPFPVMNSKYCIEMVKKYVGLC